MWHELATKQMPLVCEIKQLSWLQVCSGEICLMLNHSTLFHKKKGVPERTPSLTLFFPAYGVRRRKNCDGLAVLIGTALENAPKLSKVPWIFVVQVATGLATLVEVNQV